MNRLITFFSLSGRRKKADGDETVLRKRREICARNLVARRGRSFFLRDRESYGKNPAPAGNHHGQDLSLCSRIAPLAPLSPPPPVPSGGTVESPSSAAEVDRQRTGLPRPAGGWGGSGRDALRTAAGSAVGTPAGQPDPPEGVPGCHRRLGRGLVTPRLLVSHSGSASRGGFPRDFPRDGAPA